VTIDAAVRVLEVKGATLGAPRSSKKKSSRHGRMRELQIQHQGRPIRVFYALDPRRVAILLIGGDKTGDARFYERMVPETDRLYDEHLEELKREGRIT
jgi:hypothetical protein